MTFQKGQPSLLKGFTKETHPGIARAAAAKRGKSRPHLSGALHPNWKGGATGEARTIRNSEAYAEWRKAVFARDDHTCQSCQQRGGKLVAHHIEPFSENPLRRLDVDNGLTLCESCHAARHPERPGMGRGEDKAPRKPFSAEHRAKLSAAHKGRPTWNKGSKGVMEPWNKGLTKETSESVARMAEANRTRMTGKKGPDSPVWKRWHPE